MLSSRNIVGMLPPLFWYSRASLIQQHSFIDLFYAPSTMFNYLECIPTSRAIDGIRDTLVIYCRPRFTGGWMLLRASAFSQNFSRWKNINFAVGIVSGTRRVVHNLGKSTGIALGSEPRKRLIWFTAESPIWEALVKAALGLLCARRGRVNFWY